MAQETIDATEDWVIGLSSAELAAHMTYLGMQANCSRLTKANRLTGWLLGVYTESDFVDDQSRNAVWRRIQLRHGFLTNISQARNNSWSENSSQATHPLQAIMYDNLVLKMLYRTTQNQEQTDSCLDLQGRTSVSYSAQGQSDSGHTSGVADHQRIEYVTLRATDGSEFSASTDITIEVEQADESVRTCRPTSALKIHVPQVASAVLQFPDDQGSGYLLRQVAQMWEATLNRYHQEDSAATDEDYSIEDQEELVCRPNSLPPRAERWWKFGHRRRKDVRSDPEVQESDQRGQSKKELTA